MRRTAAILVVAALAATRAARADGEGAERPLSELLTKESATESSTTAKASAPKPAEWAAAPGVRPTRRGAAAASCRVHVVRDWIRVRCETETFAISLLGGDGSAAFWIDPKTKAGEAQFRLRPGGRQVIQLWKAGKDERGGFAPAPAVVVQAYWLSGAAPVLTLF